MIVDHVLDDLFSVTDRIVAFDFGTPIAEGDSATVLKDERVRSSYLGEGGVRSVTPCRGRAGEPVISLRGIAHHYDGVHALRGVDLEIAAGQRRYCAIVASASTTRCTLSLVMLPDFAEASADVASFAGAPNQPPDCLKANSSGSLMPNSGPRSTATSVSGSCGSASARSSTVSAATSGDSPKAPAPLTSIGMFSASSAVAYGAIRSFFFRVRIRKSLNLRRPASTSDRM